MLAEITPPDTTVLFVGQAVTETSEIVGFYHVQPKDRFWDLLEIGGITPKRFMTAQERKALVQGHKDGSLSDPVRAIFTQKKTSQLHQLGIGLTDLNRREPVADEREKSARPTLEDIASFLQKVEPLQPKIAAFVLLPDLFVALFKDRFPSAAPVLGLQSFSIGSTEVWLLGSTTAQLRGEALTNQEDAFFALGERIEAIKGGPQ